MEKHKIAAAAEHPILFSASMVQAILDNRKDVTRRVVKGTVWCLCGHTFEEHEPGRRTPGTCTSFQMDWDKARCPCGLPGDRLWIRETWRRRSVCSSRIAEVSTIEYRAGGPMLEVRELGTGRVTDVNWRPSLFLPRAYSRLLLTVADIWPERLQDITDAEAIREGVLLYHGWETPEYLRQVEATRAAGTKPPPGLSPRDRFRHLWETINGPGSWARNDLVYRIEFRRFEGKA